jgi:putative ABC transport system permease protein
MRPNRLWRRYDRLLGADPASDVKDELHFHLEAKIDDLIAQGWEPRAARQEAERRFGDFRAVQHIGELIGEKLERRKHLSEYWSDWVQDLRYAARMLAKSPGFTSVAVLTLALGIGANATIFSVVNAVLLRPLPYTNPGQLVNVAESRPEASITGAGISWPVFTELQFHSQVFSAVAGLAGHALTLTGHGEPADVSTVAVTPDFFTVLEAKPLLGRVLLPDDGKRGAAPAVVMSENLWRNSFGADPRIAGSSIMLDQRSYTVAGVMPAGFHTPFFNQTEQVWIPLLHDPLFGGWTTRPPQVHWMPVIARLRPDVSVKKTRAEMLDISPGLASQFPEESGWLLGVEPLQQVIVGDVRSPLLLLLGAVALVFLIACANIANLLLTRATSRSREIAIRIALGANKRRIARQLLTESTILGLLGGAAGIGLAWWSVSAVALLLTPELQQIHAIRLDGSVLGFAVVLSMTASLLSGLAPVLYAVRSNPQQNLREGAGAGEARGSQHARSFLATAEVALAMIILVGAGLLLRSFTRLLSVSPGFETEHVVKAEISLPRFQYAKPEQWAAFSNELMTHLRTRPDLQNSAIAAPLPILDTPVTLPFVISGNPPLPQGTADTANYVTASPQYFGVMGISVIRGRLFTADDTDSAPPVAVISQTLAKRYFPHQDPLGRQLMFGFTPQGNVSRQIVGVVADIRDVSLARNPGPMLYVPFAQAPLWGGEVVVRSRLGTAVVADAIRAATHNIDKDLPVTEIESLTGALNASVAEPRFRTLLLGVFSGIALLLAAIGIYGVVSFSVSRRTREIGVRMALGATPASVLRLVIGESGKLLLFGLAVGIPAALALTRFMSTLLFGVAPTDPLTFAVVALLLAFVTLAAAYVPARRAMHVDPMVALRCE